jgi:hypothetical protein
LGPHAAELVLRVSDLCTASLHDLRGRGE